jgi:hypothetical protein
MLGLCSQIKDLIPQALFEPKKKPRHFWKKAGQEKAVQEGDGIETNRFISKCI